jgi:hypothetical protein
MICISSHQTTFWLAVHQELRSSPQHRSAHQAAAMLRFSPPLRLSWISKELAGRAQTIAVREGEGQKHGTSDEPKTALAKHICAR